MQAIVTRYLGPTNFRGSRIKATADAGSITIPYPHELSGEDVHRAAADALLIKLGWDEAHGYRPFRLVAGGLPDGRGYAFVIAYEPEVDRCAYCNDPMNVTVRGHHHTENGVDVTRPYVKG